MDDFFGIREILESKECLQILKFLRTSLLQDVHAEALSAINGNMTDGVAEYLTQSAFRVQKSIAMLMLSRAVRFPRSASSRTALQSTNHHSFIYNE